MVGLQRFGDGCGEMGGVTEVGGRSSYGKRRQVSGRVGGDVRSKKCKVFCLSEDGESGQEATTLPQQQQQQQVDGIAVTQ